MILQVNMKTNKETFIIIIISDRFLTPSDDKDQKKSQKILTELENIDDECDQHDIAFVKIDNDKEAKEYGIDTIPTLVFFEKGIPHIFEGELVEFSENNILKLYNSTVVLGGRSPV